MLRMLGIVVLIFVTVVLCTIFVNSCTEAMKTDYDSPAMIEQRDWLENKIIAKICASGTYIYKWRNEYYTYNREKIIDLTACQ